jgi:hypothetical protein
LTGYGCRGAGWSSELNQQRSLLTEELVRLRFLSEIGTWKFQKKKVARARAVQGPGKKWANHPALRAAPTDESSMEFDGLKEFFDGF